MIAEGVLGRVLHVTIAGPHRLSRDQRPDWFFRKEQYGGIITDIMSHQFEQFLHFTGESDAIINFARIENFANPDKPELEDFGEVSLTGANGASAYCRADWFTPDGLRAWGDGRVFIVGTKGTMELRKYLDVARDGPPDKIFLVDDEAELEIDCSGKVGFPFFGHFILDCLHRTENAMTQKHAFKAAELSLQDGSGIDKQDRLIKDYQRAFTDSVGQLSATMLAAQALPEAYQALALAYRRMGKMALELRAYEDLIALAPDSPRAETVRREIEALPATGERR